MKGFKIILIVFMIIKSGSVLSWDQPAIEAFIQRIMHDRAASFVVEKIPAENGKDVFELESRGDKIVLRGNDGISIGSALNYYLKHYCHCLITWNGVNMNLPDVLPKVNEKVRKTSPYRFRYYLNYCTFNYSMAWWNWERWQWEIDWMTLNGINMPLAITGEASVWNRVYRKMGFSKEQLDRFFCGPSYFAWFWMGNLDAWGGPLSQHWMDTHEELQKKILKAERSMGMTPVLPAFTGHVPPSFHEKYPGAKVKKTNWNGSFEDVLVLDPSDPMFDKIGKAFLEEQTKAYGTDHLYSADTFNENVPPTDDSTYLNDISRKVFASMADTDPKAVWVMQGWMFHYDSAYWHPTQIQALLNAVPNDQMIILDLYSESFPLWNRTHAYYGKPWIWNMLNNFGGNITMWGRIDNPASDPATALHDTTSGRMAGIGLAPEAIEQNPVLYQLMTENVWRDKPVNLEEWLKEYALQRYGKFNKDVDEGWHILANSVYQGGLTEGGPESIITARPTLDSANRWARTNLEYNPNQLVAAWELFMKAAPLLKKSDGFRYDLVDITRQALANYAISIQQGVGEAFTAKNKTEFKKYTSEYLELIDDLNELLGTRKDFLLGKWIADARSHGITAAEKDLYEFNARDLITLWGGKESPLHDYSCREWNGMLEGFYKPRWVQFFDYLSACLDKNEPADFQKINEQIKDWEWKWVNSHEKYMELPKGDEVDLCMKMFKKYKDDVTRAF